MLVLERDDYRCQVVEGCPTRADTVDHVDPVTPLTSDEEFFDQARLRAACRTHNLARSHAATLGLAS